MRKKFQKFFRLAVSITLISGSLIATVYACCEWVDPFYNFARSLFDAENTNEPQMNDVHFTESLFNDYENGERNSEKPDSNTLDWYNHLNKQVSQEDIRQFLYEAEAYVSDEASGFNNFLSAYNSYKLIAYLKQQNHKDLLYYLYIAKSNEYGRTDEDYTWNYFPENDYYGTKKLKEQEAPGDCEKIIINQLHKEKNPFLKPRLAFQLIRNYRYRYAEDKADSVFRTYFKNLPANYLYYEAMNYAADALYNTGQLAECNYYEAIICSRYPEKRERALNNFSDDLSVDDVLKLCKSSEEKSLVYTTYLQAVYQPNPLFLQEALKLDPQNPVLSSLLVTEISMNDRFILPDWLQQEETFAEPEWGESDESTKDQTEASQILYEIADALGKFKPASYDFHELCKAHISLQMRKYDRAADHLKGLNKKLLSNKQITQWHITNILLQILGNNLGNIKPHNQIAEAFDEITKEQNLTEEVKNTLYAVLSHKLEEDGDLPRACLTSSSMYQLLEQSGTAETIDSLIAIISSPRTQLDRLLILPLTNEVNTLWETKGNILMRNDDQEQAMYCFAKTDNRFYPINYARLNTEPDGPFFDKQYSSAKDLYIPEADVNSENNWNEFTLEQIKARNARLKAMAFTYNPYSIAREMVQLKQQIKNRKGNLANHYYNLACLYFEITYYGRASDVMKITEEVHDCSKAIDNYKKALELTKSPELKAKCLYALFRCERYRKNNTEGIKDADIQYLFALHDGYRNTKYFKIKECWGLSAYVRELRKGIK